jgi:hypothetical protein
MSQGRHEGRLSNRSGTCAAARKVAWTRPSTSSVGGGAQRSAGWSPGIDRRVAEGTDLAAGQLTRMSGSASEERCPDEESTCCAARDHLVSPPGSPARPRSRRRVGIIARIVTGAPAGPNSHDPDENVKGRRRQRSRAPRRARGRAPMVDWR